MSPADNPGPADEGAPPPASATPATADDPTRLLEAVLRAATEHAVIATDAEGRIVVFNRGAEKLLGYSAEEVVGRETPLRFHDPEQVAARAAELGVVPGLAVLAPRRGTEAETAEWDYLRKDGRRVPVSLTTSAVLDEGGGLRGYLGIATDQSERSALDRARRDSEARLRAIIDAAPAVISLKDLEGRYVLVNRFFEESFGVRADELVGHTPSRVYPGDVVERVRSHDARVLTTGERLTFEQVLPHAYGSERTYLALKFPLRTADGEVSGVCTIATDVSELARAEAALRDSEERFRQVADHIDEAVILMTMEPPEVLFVNPAFDRVFGLDRRRFTADATAALEVVDRRDRDNLAQAAQAAIARREEVELEFRLTGGAGADRWARCRMRPVAAGASQTDRWSVTVTDITVQKQAELAMRRALGDAERANRAKSDFLSRMSHELRTPLNAILGFGQLLEMEEEDVERRDSVDQILKAGRHLLALIDEILEVSRLETGQLRLSIEPVDLAALVGEALAMFRPVTAERALRLSSSAAPGAWGWVMADHQRLKQVLLNLLSNAVKYNREGGSVEVEADQANGEVTLLTVRDTGIGIPVEDLDRAFVAFDRLGADSSGEEGTGLGLTLSKGLVEAMGGAIGVTSEVGVGTTFWLELRRAAAPSHTVAAPAGPAPAPARAPAVQRRVLYVEDNLSNVRLVERLFARRPGVELITAMQGGLALELAGQHRPDLVLLDLNLPDIDGEEVLRRLKAEPATEATPVVVISADALPRQAERLVALGAAEYLTKPIDLERFYAVVDQLLVR